MGKLVKKYRNNIYQIVYRLDRSENMNFREAMLLVNPGITSLASLQVTKHRAKYILSCQFQNHMQLNEYISSKISVKEFNNLMSSIINILVTFNKLQMDQQSIVLDEQYIFIDRSTKAVTVIYLPLTHSTKKYEISYFLSSLLHQVELSSSQTVVQKYIEFIESGKPFHSLAFAEFHEQEMVCFGGDIKKQTEQYRKEEMPLPEFRTLPESFFQKKENE